MKVELALPPSLDVVKLVVDRSCIKLLLDCGFEHISAWATNPGNPYRVWLSDRTFMQSNSSKPTISEEQLRQLMLLSNNVPAQVALYYSWFPDEITAAHAAYYKQHS